MFQHVFRITPSLLLAYYIFRLLTRTLSQTARITVPSVGHPTLLGTQRCKVGVNKALLPRDGTRAVAVWFSIRVCQREDIACQ